MAQVCIDDLHAGMILAEDLFTPTGRFVLAAGAALAAEHLSKFKDWEIIEAEIADESLVMLERMPNLVISSEPFLVTQLIRRHFHQHPPRQYFISGLVFFEILKVTSVDRLLRC
ncbi:MAG: hypothetical protein KAT62_13995 [Desulfuromonadales bacterium]|nr:hypothetical protein [Desulfuromonadales bacterium]